MGPENHAGSPSTQYCPLERYRSGWTARLAGSLRRHIVSLSYGVLAPSAIGSDKQLISAEFLFCHESLEHSRLHAGKDTIKIRLITYLRFEV